MKKRRLLITAVLVITSTFAAAFFAACATGNRGTPPLFVIPEYNPEIDGMRIGDYVPGKGTLIWRDEFTGTELDRTRWNPETGTGNQYGLSDWGNRELQWYSPDNVFIENGMLVIEARDVRGSPVGDPARHFTSGRITTGQTRLAPGLEWTPETFAVTTGRVEGRMRTPRGVGFWPAFWLLGANSYGPVRGHPHMVWPRCGEIDIMEFFGGREYMLVHAIHFGPHWPENRHRSWNTHLPGEALFSDGFHVYGVEWDRHEVRWLLNGEIVHRVGYDQLDDRPGASDWMQNFFNDAGFSIILNIAIGGNMGMGVPAPESFNGVDNRLTVDWVRVFKQD